MRAAAIVLAVLALAGCGEPEQPAAPTSFPGSRVAPVPPAPGVLSGRILEGESLRPVSSSFVTLASAAAGDLGTVGTDGDGAFRLEGIPAGFHRLVAWHGAEGSDPAPEIAVLPGEEVRDVLLVLRPRAVVKLRIETPSGRAPPGLRCVLESPPEIVEPIRLPTGSLELRASPGSWTLHVDAPGFRTHLETMELESYDRRFVTVELSTGVSVLGRVLDRDGNPVAGAVVERLRLDEPLAEGDAWTTDATGRFDLAGGAPAPTRFRVSALGCRPVVESLALEEAGFILRHDFTLERLPAAGAIEGRVVDAEDRGLPDVPVRLSVPRLPLGTGATTGPDGLFRFEGLAEGAYTVALVDPGELLAPEAKPAGPGGPPLRLVRRLRPVVEVRARFPGGGAPPLWRARAESASGARWSVTGGGEAPAAVRVDGPEPISLSLDAPGHADPAPVRVQPAWDRSSEVTVPVDPRPRTGTLVFWLVTRDDLPLGVPHRLRVTGPAGETAERETDPLGGLVLRRLAAGAYRLAAVREGAAEDAGAPSAEVSVPDGGRERRTLRADPALVVLEDRAPGEGRPLATGDGLIWAAGTRLERQADLDEILRFFGDREIGIEWIRGGESRKARAPASALRGYRFAEGLR